MSASTQTRIPKAVAFQVSARYEDDTPAVVYKHPDADEVYWFELRDEAGVIVTVDLDFNVKWTGTKERASRVLSATLMPKTPA